MTSQRVASIGATFLIVTISGIFCVVFLGHLGVNNRTKWFSFFKNRLLYLKYILKLKSCLQNAVVRLNELVVWKANCSSHTIGKIKTRRRARPFSSHTRRLLPAVSLHIRVLPFPQGDVRFLNDLRGGPAEDVMGTSGFVVCT